MRSHRMVRGFLYTLFCLLWGLPFCRCFNLQERNFARISPVLPGRSVGNLRLKNPLPLADAKAPLRVVSGRRWHQRETPSRFVNEVDDSGRMNFSFGSFALASALKDAEDGGDSDADNGRVLRRSDRKDPWWRRVASRFDTLESAPGLDPDDVLTSGIFRRIRRFHDPITYFVLAIASGFRWDWCFRSPLYWFAVGFCIKWYRARYVFKIPVWDRQPNWNNIITSKEQEKDLKAYTCKNCGSTIFIAKTREFFFEGSTGIGGLGCFSCGAKGKDNFIMDRDRIVEDVADVDDYFEYERPLDFVSRAERRKVLKETQGDEDKANQLLIERSTGGGQVNGEVLSETQEESEVKTDADVADEDKEGQSPAAPEKVDASTVDVVEEDKEGKDAVEDGGDRTVSDEVISEPTTSNADKSDVKSESKSDSNSTGKKTKSESLPKLKKSRPDPRRSSSNPADDDLSILEMD